MVDVNEHSTSEGSAHHPADDPSVWGWNGEAGIGARIGGWVVVVILLLMITTTHYNHMGTAMLAGSAAALIAILLWDRARRKSAWRE